MLDVKHVFDPGQLLNPRKIFPEQVPVPVPAEARPRRGAVRKSPCAPATEKEAAQVIRAWLKAGHTIRIQGAGTKSQPAQAGEWALSTRALQDIQRCDLENLYVTAAAGVPLARLQAELEPHGMWVPLVSPWGESTLGGIVSTNFNAPLRMRYGGVRDLLLAANVVLPDGRFLRLGRPVVKNVAGYDMPKLFVGAYGSLGLITQLTFKLVPRPRARASMVMPVSDLKRGLAWAAQLLQVCLNASSLLLCRGWHGLAATPYALIYTVEGTREDVAAELAQARQALEAAGAGQVERDDERSGSQEWAAWLGASVPGPADGREPQVTLRLGVAPKDLPRLLEDQRPVLDETAFFADMANGLLYVQSGADIVELGPAAQAIGGYALVLAAPPPAGPPTSRSRYASDSQELMCRLKTRWDASGQLNPGVVVSG
jgi:D-lactate dehydrogenase (cytochrome)